MKNALSKDDEITTMIYGISFAKAAIGNLTFLTTRDVMSTLEAPKEKEDLSKKGSDSFNKGPVIYRDFEFITSDQVSLFEAQQDL